MAIISIPRALLLLLSLAILAIAGYLLWSWLHGVHYLTASGVWRRRHGPAWWLVLGLGLLAWSFLGRLVVLALLPVGGHTGGRGGDSGWTIQAPDGASLRLRAAGPADAPLLVLTHGWGLDSTAWMHARDALAVSHRVVTWDLPGLGGSRLAPDHQITLDRLAQGLGAVIEASGGGPVVLVGHSIGGMVIQTLWRAAPASAARVSGVVLIHTTHENPLRTMWLSGLWRALRWPLIEPICWATIALWPLAWLSAWQGYLSGASHLAMRLTGFGRYATRGDVDLTARLAARGSPGVQAKGNLAMLRWRIDETLPAIAAPTLVLCGSRDLVTQPRASRFIAEALPDARLRRIEGTGHMGFLERAELYEAAIAEFVRDIGAPGPRDPWGGGRVTSE